MAAVICIFIYYISIIIDGDFLHNCSVIAIIVSLHSTVSPKAAVGRASIANTIGRIIGTNLRFSLFIIYFTIIIQKLV